MTLIGADNLQPLDVGGAIRSMFDGSRSGERGFFYASHKLKRVV